jgi:hypothetical protein
MITKEQIIEIAREELTPIGWHEEHAKYIDGLDAFAERLVKLFCQPAVSGRSEQLDCCGCDYVRINDNCMECRKCGNVIDVAI